MPPLKPSAYFVNIFFAAVDRKHWEDKDSWEDPNVHEAGRFWLYNSRIFMTVEEMLAYGKKQGLLCKLIAFEIDRENVLLAIGNMNSNQEKIWVKPIYIWSDRFLLLA